MPATNHSLYAYSYQPTPTPFPLQFDPKITHISISTTTNFSITISCYYSNLQNEATRIKVLFCTALILLLYDSIIWLVMYWVPYDTNCLFLVSFMLLVGLISVWVIVDVVSWRFLSYLDAWFRVGICFYVPRGVWSLSSSYWLDPSARNRVRMLLVIVRLVIFSWYSIWPAIDIPLDTRQDSTSSHKYHHDIESMCKIVIGYIFIAFCDLIQENKDLMLCVLRPSLWILYDICKVEWRLMLIWCVLWTYECEVEGGGGLLLLLVVIHNCFKYYIGDIRKKNDRIR